MAERGSCMMSEVGKEKTGMHFNYNKLWKLLIDKGMKKQDLRAAAGISSASIAKLGRGENITTDVLLRICMALNCDISDIMELAHDDVRYCS